MPRKMSGSAISMMEELTVAISMPSVVLDSAIHLYRDPALVAGSMVRGWDETDGTGAPPETMGLTWHDPVPQLVSCYIATKLCRSLFPPRPAPPAAARARPARRSRDGSSPRRSAGFRLRPAVPMKPDLSHTGPARTGAYDVNATFMQLGRHEWDIHAV